MRTNIIGEKQVTVDNDIREAIEKKLAKFDKFFKDDASATVKLRHTRGKDILELTISSNGMIYRSEKENTSYYNALDEVVEAIERQLRKNKTRLERRLRDGAFAKNDYSAFSAQTAEIEEESEFEIREKAFFVKPMSTEEAILQMNLSGHEFFVFEDEKEGQMNVVYKRKDGKYGLIRARHAE